MGIFPYNPVNPDHYILTFIGTPLTEDQAMSLAETIREFHVGWRSDGDWDELDPQKDERLAFGLMALLADPSYVRMIIALGNVVEEDFATIARTPENEIDPSLQRALTKSGLL